MAETKAPKREFDAQREVAGLQLERAIHETVAMSTVAKSLNIATKQVEQLVSEYGKAKDRGWLTKGSENTPIAKLFDAAKQRMADMRAGRIAVDFPQGRRLPDLQSDGATTPKGRSMAVKSITQGIWGALGGKRMRYLTHAFKVGGPAGLAVAGASILKDAFVARASAAQQTVLSAGAAGISANEMRGLERAMKAQGAGSGSAANLANLIQQYVTGVKLGRDPGPLKELRRIGADISPYYTFAENLENIADALSRVDKETASQIAALSGIDAGALAFLRQGGENAGRTLQMYEGKDWVDKLGKANVATNKLGLAFDDLQDSLLVSFAPAINWTAEVLEDWAKKLAGIEDDLPELPKVPNITKEELEYVVENTPEGSPQQTMAKELLLEREYTEPGQPVEESKELQNQGYMLFNEETQKRIDEAKRAEEQARAEEEEIRQLLREYGLEDSFPRLDDVFSGLHEKGGAPLGNDVSGDINVNINGPAPDELKSALHHNIVDTVTHYYDSESPVDFSISGAK